MKHVGLSGSLGWGWSSRSGSSSPGSGSGGCGMEVAVLVAVIKNITSISRVLVRKSSSIRSRGDVRLAWGCAGPNWGQC